MGAVHPVKLAGLEMDPHQYSGAFQIFPRQNPQVEKAACRTGEIVVQISNKKIALRIEDPRGDFYGWSA